MPKLLQIVAITADIVTPRQCFDVFGVDVIADCRAEGGIANKVIADAKGRADAHCNRVKPRCGAAGKDDVLHGSERTP